MEKKKKRHGLVTATVSSLFVVWEKTERKSRIIIHSPSNPGFLYGRAYCHPVGGLP